MAQSGAIRAGRAYVELFADGSKLAGGLKAAAAKLQAFGSSVQNMGLKLMGLGTAVLAPLLGAAKTYADTGAGLARMSAETGVAVEELSALAFAANMSQVEMDTLAAGIKKMQRTIVQAGEGSKPAVQTLNRLGLTFADLAGLTPDQQLKAFADKLGGIEDPAIRAAMAMEVFGRGGAAMLPMMKNGAAGIEALERRARDLGLIISSDDAKAAKKFSDALKELWAVVKRGVFAVGSALAPILKGCAEWIAKVVNKVREWIDTHQEVVQRILITAGVVLGLGAALVVLGQALKMVGFVLGGLGTVLKLAVVGFKIIAAAIGFLLTPLGAILAVVAAVAGYFLYSSGAMGKATTWLGEKFSELRSDAEQAYQGIADALAAGDIGLAVKILWLTIKLEWTKGINWLLEQWYLFKAAFMEIALKAWYGALAGLTIAWGALERAWIHTVSFLSRVWTDFVAGIQSAWAISQTWLAKQMVEIQGMFDKTLDVEAVKKSIDERGRRELAGIGLNVDAKDAEIEQEKQRRLAKSREDEASTLATIGTKYDEAEKARKEKLGKEITGLDEDLANAKAEWQDALNKAKAARKAKALEKPEALKPPPKLDVALEQAKKRTIDVSGTFSAAALWGLGAGKSLAERTASAAEDTAKNTKKIADDLDGAEGIVFE